MTGTYFIRRLSQNHSIVQHLKLTRKGNTIPLFEIERDTISQNFGAIPINPKAANFLQKRKHLPVYLVFYSNSESTHCLFLFTFQYKSTGTPVLEICRCLGKRRTKRHWKTVIKYIDDNRSLIESLPYM